MDKAAIYTDRDDPSSAELRAYFADLFVHLDAEPRKLMLTVSVRNDRHSRASIDMEDGEPVFRVGDHPPAKASFRGRWLAEHPVPLVFPRFRPLVLVLEPAGGNRVRVRRPTLTERIFG